MSCQVTYNKDGSIKKVLDSNGNESKLFIAISKLPVVKSLQEALDIYKQTYKFAKKKQNSLSELYLDRANRVKKTNPSQYWSFDIPSESIVTKAEQQGRIVDIKGTMGIVTPEGTLIGMFKYDDSFKGASSDVQKARVELGGIKLDNYDGYLTKLYEKNGFRVVSRVAFNEDYAPESWNRGTHGTPDVVFMIYDPNKELDIEEKSFDKNSIENAEKYRDSFVEEAKKLHPYYNQNKSADTQDFFSDVVTGKSDKFKPNSSCINWHCYYIYRDCSYK